MPTSRTYVSPHRERAAARTRELIVSTAKELFSTEGYGRVTVADVAAGAGVAQKTVYASVGSKTDILDRIVDDAVEASGYKTAIEQLATTRTRAAAVKVLAHGTRTGNEGQAAVLEMIRRAVPLHEDGDALWRRATDPYRAALGFAAAHIARLGRLPSAISRDALGDLLWLWFGPASWHSLVVESGWGWDDAETALYRTALAALGSR